MKVSVGIPFYGDQPDRVRNVRATREYFQKLMGEILGWESSPLTSNPMITNRGAARNDLVRRCINDDVIVLADADCWPEKDALDKAIYGAYAEGGLHFAFSKYRELPEKATKLWLAGNQERAIQTLHMECLGSVGGCMAIRPTDWARAGWSPELDQWGFEDVIFSCQTRTLLDHDNQWHEGWLTHLYHPSEVRVGSESWNTNIDICKQFEAVDGDRDSMLALIKSGLGKHPTPTFFDSLNMIL